MLLALINLSYCCFPPAPWPSPLSECFSPSCHFCRAQFPVMYSSPLRFYDWHGACLCPEMIGSSVMWWVYIFKNNPHSSDYEPNSNLKFCCWWWLYIYFSVQKCTVMETIVLIVGFHFFGYFCVLHVVLKHFRENEPPPHTHTGFIFCIVFFPPPSLCFPNFSNWYPLALLILSLYK